MSNDCQCGEDHKGQYPDKSEDRSTKMPDKYLWVEKCRAEEGGYKGVGECCFEYEYCEHTEPPDRTPNSDDTEYRTFIDTMRKPLMRKPLIGDKRKHRSVIVAELAEKTRLQSMESEKKRRRL